MVNGSLLETAHDFFKITFNIKKCLDDLRIKMLPAFSHDHRLYLFMAKPFTVTAIRTQRVIEVRQRNDSC